VLFLLCDIHAIMCNSRPLIPHFPQPSLSHWGSFPTSQPKSTLKSKSPKSPPTQPKSTLKSKSHKKPPTRAQQLAAATMSSTLLRKNQTPKRENSSVNNKSSTTPSFGLNAWPKWDKNAKTEASFGPSFLSNKKRKHPATMDTVADDDSTDGDPRDQSSAANYLERDAIFATPRPTRQTPHHSPKSGGSNYGAYSNSPQYRTPAKRRRKKAKGPLAQMLQSIRGSIEADRARFHSGTYPYRPATDRRHDVNDPRNRADTFMDVTIVGNSTPFASTSKAAILGYVHSFSRNDAKIKTVRMPGRSRRFRHAASSTAAATSTIEKNTETKEALLETPTFAWMCFTHETFMEHGIGNGTQLRIYNACTVGSDVHPIVVCTRLCEVYPKELPPLFVPNR